MMKLFRADITVTKVSIATILYALCLMVHVQRVSGHGSNQMTFIVPSQQRTCFSRVWGDSEKIFFEYQVLKGGNNDLDIQIITPNGMVLYNKSRANKDEVTFTPQNGEFSFCFSNEFSRMTDKVVTFSIRPAFTDSLSQETGNKEPTVKMAAATSCDGIHEATTVVLDFQRKYRIRESIGRHLAEQLNIMVLWWSVGQSLVVLMCGVGQVLVLRTLFTEKRISTKPAEGEPEEKQVTSYPIRTA